MTLPNLRHQELVLGHTLFEACWCFLYQFEAAQCITTSLLYEYRMASWHYVRLKGERFVPKSCSIAKHDFNLDYLRLKSEGEWKFKF